MRVILSFRLVTQRKFGAEVASMDFERSLLYCTCFSCESEPCANGVSDKQFLVDYSAESFRQFKKKLSFIF